MIVVHRGGLHTVIGVYIIYIYKQLTLLKLAKLSSKSVLSGEQQDDDQSQTNRSKPHRLSPRHGCMCSIKISKSSAQSA